MAEKAIENIIPFPVKKTESGQQEVPAFELEKITPVKISELMKNTPIGKEKAED